MKTRQVKIERKRSKRINRKAKQMVGRQTHVFQQGNNKGYDVEMIRDFLDQLLLEIRVQHHENLKCISELKKHENLKDLSEKLDKDVSPALVRELQTYLRKYQTQLICGDSIDGDNATKEEIQFATENYLKFMTSKRDEQIGHLEALQELVDESLVCAKVPLGKTREGHLCSPTRVFNVRNWIDLVNQQGENHAV